MPDGYLNADPDQYLTAAAMNMPPPPILSDPLVAGATTVEQLLRVLGLAANADDPLDNAEALDQHDLREAEMHTAADTFATQDRDSTAAMTQLASGLAGALTGALQPLAQIPQQISQGAQQAAQAAMGVFQGSGVLTGSHPDEGSLDIGNDVIEDFSDPTAADDVDGDPGSGGSDSAIGRGGVGATTPSGVPGPPAVPSASTSPAATAPAPATMSAKTPTPAPAPAAGMAGMPMVPPGGAGAGGTADAKADTKRVSVPTVRNGAPVQGRITAPPSAGPLVRKSEGKPVAARIVPPGHSTA